MRKISYLHAFASFLWSVSPAIVSLLTFTLFTFAGAVLTPSLAFTVKKYTFSIV